MIVFNSAVRPIADVKCTLQFFNKGTETICNYLTELVIFFLHGALLRNCKHLYPFIAIFFSRRIFKKNQTKLQTSKCLWHIVNCVLFAKSNNTFPQGQLVFSLGLTNYLSGQHFAFVLRSWAVYSSQSLTNCGCYVLLKSRCTSARLIQVAFPSRSK